MKLGFITIHTKDVHASVDFYEKILGFKVVRRFSPRPGGEIAFMDDGSGGTVEFIKGDGEKVFDGSGVSIGFYVDDIEKTAAFLKSQNVAIVSGPVTVPNGTKLLGARDVNGLDLGFVQMPKKG